jgi:hypothetical protein
MDYGSVKSGADSLRENTEERIAGELGINADSINLEPKQKDMTPFKGEFQQLPR